MKKLLIVLNIVFLGVIAYLIITREKEPVVEISATKNQTIAPGDDVIPPGPLLTGEEEKTISEETDYVKIIAKYPSFKNKGKSEYIERVVREEINDFKEDSGLNNISKTNDDAAFPNGTKYEFNTTYKVYSTENTATIVLSIYTYTGGAHGNLFIRTLNFERSTEGLEIGSLFTPGSNYLTKLSELSRPKLKADLKENLGNWSDDGTSPITKNFEAFYLTPGKLHIIFQPYQVAPWVSGAPEISFDIKDELGGVISPVFLNE